MTDAGRPEKAPNFHCIKCNFTCSKNYEWSRHVSTRKHQNLVQYLQKALPYNCLCGKTYKHRQSLFTHKKVCDYLREKNNFDDDYNYKNDADEISVPIPKQETSITNDMILSLIEQNKELQKQLVEMSKQTSVVNNTTNNTMNNQFNLNVFLNEDCKDALNIADFVESLKLTVNDLEQTGNLGFTQGITRIFVQGLKNLDVNMRPLHCTDIKRETVYIKDQDTWEKENAEKTKLRNVLKKIARKNMNLLPKWQEQNPDFKKLNTKENEDFIQISLSSLGGECDEDQDKMDEKIIKNVLKEVVLDKKKSNMIMYDDYK
jgi:hypothetical protein